MQLLLSTCPLCFNDTSILSQYQVYEARARNTLFSYTSIGYLEKGPSFQERIMFSILYIQTDKLILGECVLNTSEEMGSES